MADAGDDRCEILLSIKTDIKDLNSISPKDKIYLEKAINKLLSIYHCPSE